MALDDPDRIPGVLLGLALGDALGAPHEGGLAERLLWRLIGRTRAGEMRWTDDTQMALDVAESLIEHGRVDEDDLARRFAASHRWSRGYGRGAAKVLKRVRGGADWREANRSVHREGSFGNGGAMRAPVIGAFYASRPEALEDAARRATLVTHAHPLGIEGAILVARATADAMLGGSPDELLERALAQCAGDPFRTRLGIAARWLRDGGPATAHRVRDELGNGIAAPDSCVTAIYCALRFADASFDELQRFVASLRGDVDTIGAMAGAIWGAANGAEHLPAEYLARLEQRDRLMRVAVDLHGRRARSSPGRLTSLRSPERPWNSRNSSVPNSASH